MNEIVNKVSASGLIEINLEDFYDHSERIYIDFKDFLHSVPVGNDLAYMLKEKDFREKLNSIDPSQFYEKIVAVKCSVDAIIPTWAYMLLSITISPHAKKVVFGDNIFLENLLFKEALDKINYFDYTDKKVIIKGCSRLNVPLNAYTILASNLKPYAKSIMFGEPCSTVPLFKKPKSIDM
ncbi:MAG TPA: DUF2480 family protein [Bacteroidia bacterium]|nr:DUF2480 family protein [Bacteroidia bacterium]